jgi:hypothetical protein
MRSPRRTIAVATLILSASATACSSSPRTTASSHSPHHPARASISAAALYQSPEQATLSWFYALNHKDMAAAVAHFAPAAASMMDWYGGASAYPTFSALHCRQVSTYGTTASVLCTFKELHVEPGTQADNFWTVELQRQPDGRWLITNYGTG